LVRALAPALDLIGPGVLQWVVKLAPVDVERLGVIRYYFTTTTCLHGVRHVPWAATRALARVSTRSQCR